MKDRTLDKRDRGCWGLTAHILSLWLWGNDCVYVWVSRALGSLAAKRLGVTAEPDIVTRALLPEDRFLVSARTCSHTVTHHEAQRHMHTRVHISRRKRRRYKGKYIGTSTYMPGTHTRHAQSQT
jgi:hypothetical protein